MEASAQVDCDLENEEEDLDFFQKSIKVHDRFGGNYDEEDEFFSDDEPDEPITCQKEGYLKSITCQKGGYLKSVGKLSHSSRSSEGKIETISMLDDVRSSCSKSGPNLSLEMLNLKSDEAGLGNFDIGEGVLLGKSVLSSSPPFGDPLSEIDILDSALSLLDDKTCQKFREKGLFDRLVGEDAFSIESKAKAAEEDVICVEAKLDLVTSCDRQTPQPYRNVCDSPENVSKPLHELIHEDVSKLDAQPSVKSGPLLSCQLKKTRQSKSANSSRSQLSDCKTLDSKSSIGKEFPPSNLSLDDLVRYINGESLTKVCAKKVNAPSVALPHTNANSKKSKKQPVRKSDVSSTSKASTPLPTSKLPRTTKKPCHLGVVRTEDITEDSCPQAVCCDTVVTSNNSTAASAITASVKETVSARDVKHDDDDAALEEFVAVPHKRRIRARKEPFPNAAVHPASIIPPPQTKFVGNQPEKSSAQAEKDPGASTASTFSVDCKSCRSDTSGGSTASKRGSLSSLDDFPPPAASDTSSLCTSGNQGPTELPLARPSFSKFSYASVLLQNLPKLSVTGSHELAQTDRKCETNIMDIGTISSTLNSEVENEIYLSPPQSEADTGFSSSSSLSPDETHISLASDSVVIMSKKNQVTDSNPKSPPLDKSSCIKDTKEVGNENLEQPVEHTVCDPVSRHMSDLDFPLNRILELPGRTDRVLQNTGETILACSGQNASCANMQSKKSPVFFDTRIRTVNHPKSASDIVFVFDPEDSGPDAMLNVDRYVAVDDIDGITFTSSSDSGTLFDIAALETVNDPYAALDIEASLDTKTSVQSGCMELSEEPEIAQQSVRRVVNDRASREEVMPRPDSEFENPVCDGKLAESNVNAAVRRAPLGSFDLLTTQKFLNRAFKNVLKLERECPGQVVRL